MGGRNDRRIHHQDQYWDRHHAGHNDRYPMDRHIDRHNDQHVDRQTDIHQDTYNNGHNQTHRDRHTRQNDRYDRHDDRYNERYNRRNNDRYSHRYNDTPKEENQDGEFVEGYVIKPPKTPLDWMRRWAIQTSCNGIPNIQRTKSPVRLSIWTMIVLTGTVMTVVSVVGTVLTFLDYPYNVAVTNQLVSTIIFPAVTVCNINPVRKSKIHLGGTKMEEALIEEYEDYSSFDVTDLVPCCILQYYTLPTLKDTRVLNPYKEHARGLSNISQKIGVTLSQCFNKHVRAELREDFDNLYAQLNASVKQAMGHQLEDMLLTCHYGRDFCDVKNFSLLQNSYYGNCYIINNALDGEKPLQTHKPGAHTGMSMEFYLQPDEYVPAVTTSLGMRIAIHGNEDMPFPEDIGVYISPGFTTLIALRAKKIERLPVPFESACWDIEQEEAQAVSVYSQFYRVDYTQQACQKTCYQRHVLEACGCGDPRVPLYGIALGNNDPRHKTAIPCLTVTQETCEEHIKDVANDKGLTCNCSGACTILKYNPTLSFARWPNDEIKADYAMALKKLYPHLNNSKDFEPRESIARVEIFFDEMIVENITEQEAYPLINLYSDLGGNIGFYLGLSIVGMFELFELLIDLAGAACTCLKTKLGGSNDKQPSPTHNSRNHS